jgi:hypothetical protein
LIADSAYRFTRSRAAGFLVRPRHGAVDACERQLRLAFGNDIGHDLVPHAVDGPAAEAQVGVVPVAEFGGDRTPFGSVVEPPNDCLDRTTVFLARTRATDLDRSDCGFELGLLGVAEYCHALFPG